MIKKFQKNTLVFSVVVTVVAMALLGVCIFLSQPLNPYQYGIINMVHYFVPCVFVFCIVFALKIQGQMGFSSKGFLKGILLGWLAMAGGLVSWAASFDFSGIQSVKTQNWGMLLPFSITMLLLSLFEEILCRGILVNIMLNKWHSPKKAALVSAAIFGVAHILNLVFTPGRPIGVLTNMVFAFAVGVFFAAVYIRSKNIWAVVALHALFDWLAMVSDVLTQPAVELGDISPGGALGNIIIAIPFFLVALFLLRNKKTLASAK